MDKPEPLQNYENVKAEVLTLAEIDKLYKCADYPIIARVVQKNYEIPNALDLPGQAEVLIEEPKRVDFVLIRICEFFDEEEKRKEKGYEFVQERNKYVGKEFLIPANFSSMLRLVNKPGRQSRYVSMSQVIEDLPRLIKIQQDTPCETKPEKQPSTLSAGTILEVKSVDTPTNERQRCVTCEAKGALYLLREDIPINCIAVEDETRYTLSTIVGSMLLPKTAVFLDVWPEFVLLKDDEQAHLLLTLLGGPMKILKVCKINVFIVWIKTAESQTKSVSLVTKTAWTNQMVSVLSFSDNLKKNEYVKNNFGDTIDSSFVSNGLYNLRPVENGVINLLVPKEERKKPDLSNYENVDSGRSKEDLVDDKADYEEPAPAIPPRENVPIVPPRMPTRPSDSKEIILPTPMPRYDNFLDRIKEKARLGFDKVHEQLLKRVKTKQPRAVKKRPKPRKIIARSNSEPVGQFESQVDLEEEDSTSSAGIESKEYKTNARLQIRLPNTNVNRPLPDLPSTTTTTSAISTSKSNRTDDDKLDIYENPDEELDLYDQVKSDHEDEDENYLKMEPSSPEVEIYHSKMDTLMKLPDCNKIGRQNQTSADFYEYTVAELAECLKLCGLDELAVVCCEHKLDGCFFKKFNLNQLEEKPFSLNKLEILKMRKVIEDGWRPKLEIEKEKPKLYFV